MAVTAKVLVPRALVTNSQVTVYTAVACKAIMDKATITNTSASNATFSANLVVSGGTAGSSNLVLDGKTIAPHETYTCPELAGQMLEAGGFLSVIAGTTNVLVISVSGREIT